MVDIFTQSDYIFEATVIRSDAYWGVVNNSIYTSHTLEIHKIFKGNLVCGTVEVITQGGEVGDMRLSISHNLELAKGMTGLFACKDLSFSEAPALDYYLENNTAQLEVIFEEQGYFQYFDDGVNPVAANLFYDFDSLAQVYDVVELATQINYIDCQTSTFQEPKHSVYRSVPKSTIQNPLHSTHHALDFLASKRQAAAKNGQNPSGKLMTQSLSYSFENIQITGTGTQFIEFDIYLAADDNNGYFDAASVFIPYNPATWGTDIVTNGNVILTRGTITANATDYDEPLALDTGTPTSPQLLIVLNAIIDPPNRYNLTPVPTQAVHVKIKLLDCTQPSTLAFADTLTMLQNAFYTLTPNAPTFANIQNFQNIDISDTGNGACASSYIGYFTPASCNAGVGDILEIHGSGFGATQGNGGVFLRNANDGGLTATLLDAKDMISWADNLIRVYVPSYKDTTLASGYRITPAGTGFIKVKTNAGQILTSHYLPNPTLHIGYAYLNRLDLNGDKRKISLIDGYGPAKGGIGGYQFETFLNPNALPVLAAAINDWVCLTQVHFELGSPLPINWSTTTPANDDRNVIQFGDTPNGVLARTHRWELACSSNPTDPAVFETDIIISNTIVPNLVYDITGTLPIPAGMVDLYGVLIHELGHTHCLGHVNNPDAIMYFEGHIGLIPASQRSIHLNTDISCDIGGNAVVSHSQSTPHSNCFFNEIMTLLNGVNCGANGIEEAGKRDNIFTLFPNPVDETLRIQLANNALTDIYIYNSMGKLLESHENISDDYEFDMSNYPQGIYFIQAIQGNISSSQTILKR